MTKISIKTKNSKELGRFFEIWAKELDKAQKGMEEVFDAIGGDVADMILDQIPRRLGGGFGDFMQARTGIHVEPTQSGFRLSVFGWNESEIPDGKVGKNGEDYNLWAMYEFGKDIPSRQSASGGPLSIKKDSAASVAVIKQLAKGFRVEGKQGAVQVLVAGLMPRIERMISQAMKKYYTTATASAGNRAAKKAGLRGFELLPPAINVSDLPRKTVEIVNIAAKTGGSNFRARGPGGRYISLGNKVKKKLG